MAIIYYLSISKYNIELAEGVKVKNDFLTQAENLVGPL